MANDYALVILSMRLPYWMFREESRYHICVEEAQVNVVVEQLNIYKNENLYLKPQEKPESDEKTDLSIMAVYILILITFFMGQLNDPKGS